MKRWITNITDDRQRRVAATIKAAEELGLPVTIGVANELLGYPYAGMYIEDNGYTNLSPFWRLYEKYLAAMESPSPGRSSSDAGGR